MKGRETGRRLITVLLTALILLTQPGVSQLSTVWAAGGSTETYAVTDGYEISGFPEEAQGSFVWLKDKEEGKSYTAKVEGETAVFSGELNTEHSYELRVEKVSGYREYVQEDYRLSSSGKDTITLEKEKQKVTVTGTVRTSDRTGEKACADAKVTAKAEDTVLDTGVTDKKGRYSLEVEEGSSFTVLAQGGEKYEEVQFAVTDAQAGDLGETILYAKTYEITAEVSGTGTLTLEPEGQEPKAAEDGETVSVVCEYGDTLTAYASTGKGNEIYVFSDGDAEQTEARGKSGYSYKLDTVGEEHDIFVQFGRNPYQVAFSAKNDGQSSPGEQAHGTIQDTDGAVITEVQKVYEDQISFRIVPDQDYHTKQLILEDPSSKEDPIIISDPENADEEYLKYEKGVYTLKVSKDLKVTAVFARNQFQVELKTHTEKKDEESGFYKITYDLQQKEREELIENSPLSVYAGETLTLKLKPAAGYYVSDFSYNGESLRLDSDKFQDNMDGTYTVILSEIRQNYQLEASFEKIKEEKENTWFKEEIFDKAGANKITEEKREGETVYRYIMPSQTSLKIRYQDGEDSEIWAVGEEKEKISYASPLEVTGQGEYSYRAFYVKRLTGDFKNSVKKISLKDPLEVVIDQEKPKREGEITKTPDRAYYNRDWTVGISYKDNGGAKLAEARYVGIEAKDAENPGEAQKTAEELYRQDTFQNPDGSDERIRTAEDLGKGSYAFTAAPPESSNDVLYYIWAYDYAGNKSEFSSAVLSFDTVRPEIKEIATTPETMPTNKDVTVKIKAWDDKSGVKEVRYGTQKEAAQADTEEEKGQGVKLAKGAGNRYSFQVSNKEEFDGNYYVWAYDSAGNKSEIREVKIQIDTTSARIDSVQMVEAGTEESIEDWTNQDADILVKASDEKKGGWRSGIKKLAYTTEEKDGDPDWEKGSEMSAKQGEEEGVEFRIPIRQSLGKTMYLKVYDRAGNASEVKKIEVRVDKESPMITSVSYKADGKETEDLDRWFNEAGEKVDEEGNSIWDKVKDLIFALFGKDQIEVTVRAADPVLEGVGKSSQVEFAEVRLYEPGCDPNEPETAEVPYKELKSQNSGEPDAKEFSFTLSREELQIQETRGVLWARVTDYASNTSRWVRLDGTVLENGEDHETHSSLAVTIPETPYKDGQENPLYKEDVAFQISAADSLSGIAEISYEVVNGTETVLSETIAADISGELGGADQETGKYENWEITGREKNLVTKLRGGDFVIPAEEANANGLKIKVSMTDRAGNISMQEQTLSIDITNPSSSLEWKEGEPEETHRLEHYYKESRTGILKITERNFDAGAYSDESGAGIRFDCEGNEISLPLKEEDWELQENQENPDASTHTAILNYTEEGDYTLNLKAGDKAGNQLDPDFEKQTFTIDKTAPVIKLTAKEKPVYTDKEKRQWYKGDAAFDLQIQDNHAGIYEAEVKINGTVLKKDAQGKTLSANFSEKRQKDLSFVINTSQGKINTKENSYQIDITVYDNSGNRSTYSKKIYKDTEAPQIIRYSFAAKGFKESDGLPVKMEDYGFYFVEDTTVTVTAQDNVKTGHGSGVKSISYYLQDADSGKTKVKTVKAAETDKNSQTAKISFKIPKDFKGWVYAKATDYTTNTPKAYAKPAGVILESPGKHEESSAITFDKPDSGNKDHNGLDLFNSNVNVGITVEDRYSGIRSIELNVTSPYDGGYSKKVEIDNQGRASGDVDQWQIDKTDLNLVTKMSQTIQVGNNSNDIKVHVKLTDRAGNTSEQEIAFSIDKTAPEITITYDHSRYDSDFARETQYYKETRTATISIRERNFNSSDVKWEIANTLGTTPSPTGWVYSADSSNPDNDVYSTQLVFSADGDYTYRLSYTDMAGNAGNSVEPQKFTIDKTAPVIKVTFDNNDVKNGNYYKKERTATITITERNFETSRIQTKITATDKKKQVKAPSVSSWNSSGDTHKATVKFEKDALYQFDISYTDKAGNKAEEFKTLKFTVDKTLPTVKVQGIKQKSANNGKVIGFVLTASDTNFDTVKPVLTLVTKDKKINCKDILGEGTKTENGRTYKVKNLKEDGIYMLTCTASDKAGNVQKEVKIVNGKGKEIKTKKPMFSVNRKGSTYLLSEATRKLNGTYTQEEQDVVIKEINVNTVSNAKLTLFYGTETKTLKKDRDYTVVHKGGGSQWNEYTYTIGKENFQKDGEYSVALYSKDAAKNVSENTMDTKNVEVHFGIDKTKPNVIITNLEDKKAYSEEEREVTVVAEDNMKLASVEIYHAAYDRKADSASYGEPAVSWEGEKLEEAVQKGQDFAYTISGDTTQRHKIKVVAKDLAGCTRSLEVKDFYVTTNWWVNFKANTILFYGSIAGVLLVILGVVWLLLSRKRKESDKEEKEAKQ